MLRNLVAVGVNQYECGEYEDALWTLEHAAEIPDAGSAGSDLRASAYTAMAWLLAACPDADLRDGARALVHAQKACELTEYKDCHCLASLAAAYAESGDFPAAAKWQQKAIEHVPQEQSSDELTSRLELYQSAKHPRAERISPMVAP